jgi:hypothetical protein
MIEIGGSDWFIQVVQITYDFEQGILLLDGFVFHGVCQCQSRELLLGS